MVGSAYQSCQSSEENFDGWGKSSGVSKSSLINHRSPLLIFPTFPQKITHPSPFQTKTHIKYTLFYPLPLASNHTIFSPFHNNLGVLSRIMILWRYVQIYVCIHGSAARVLFLIQFIFLCFMPLLYFNLLHFFSPSLGM